MWSHWDNKPWHRTSDSWWLDRADRRGTAWNQLGPNNLNYGHNNYTTVDVNISDVEVQSLTFQSGATSARTINNNVIHLFYKIQNDSSAHHEFNSSITLEADSEINPVSGDLSFHNDIWKNSKYLRVYGGSGRTLVIAKLSNGGDFYIDPDDSNRGTVVKIKGGGDHSGNTYLNQGELWFQTGGRIGSGGTIYIGNQDNSNWSNRAAKLWLESAGVTLTNPVVVRCGNDLKRYIGGLNSSGVVSYRGTLQVLGPSFLEANNAGGTVEFTNVISGGGKIVLPGPGTIVFAGNNTFTSNTYVDNGTLILTNNSTAGGAGGDIFLGKDSDEGKSPTLTIASGLTVANRIVARPTANDRAVIQKGGSGNITNSGVLKLDFNEGGGVTKTIVSNQTAGVFVLSGGLDLSGPTTDNRALDVYNAIKISGPITNTGTGTRGMVLRGPGTITFDGAIKANIFQDESTHIIGPNASFPQAGTVYQLGTADNTDQITKNAYLEFQTGGKEYEVGISAGFTNSVGKVPGIRQFTFAHSSDTITLKGAVTLDKYPGYYLKLSNAQPVVVQGTLSGTGGIHKIGSGLMTLSGTATYESQTLVEDGALKLGSSTAIGAAKILLGFTNTVNNVALYLANGAELKTPMDVLTNTGLRVIGMDSTGSARFNTNIVLLKGAIFTNPAGSTVTAGGVISDVGALDKKGEGLLVLSNNNEFAGGLWVSKGTVRLQGHTNAMGAAGVFVGTNATLELNAEQVWRPVPLTLYGMGTGDATGALYVVNGSTWRGAITGAAASVKIRAVGNAFNTYGDIVLGANTLYITNSAIFDMLGGDVSGSKTTGDGAIRKTGMGRFMLRPANLTGSLFIDQGELRISTGTMPGGGEVSFAGGVTATWNTANYTITKPVNINGDITVGRAASGSLTFSNTVNLAGATRTITTIATNTISGVISSSAGGLTKAGSTSGGVLILSGANTYPGDTTISAGILRLGASGVIPDGADKGDVSLTGTLDMNGYSETINGLSGAGTVDNLSGAGTYVLTVGNDNDSSTFDGVIQNTSGTLDLTKVGTGKLTLSAQNTFGGAAYINNGILELNNTTDPLDASSVQLGNTSGSDDATLQFGANGVTLDNAVTVRAGSSGTATIKNNAAGTATLSSTVTLNKDVTLTAIADSTLAFANTLSGNWTGIVNDAGTVDIAGSTDNSSLSLNVNSGLVLLNKTSDADNHAVGKVLRVGGGTARLSGSGSDQIFNGGIVIVTNGAFDLNGKNETIATLALYGTGIGGGGALVNSSASAAALTLDYNSALSGDSIVGCTGDITLGGGGELDGSGGDRWLTKIGAGTLYLSCGTGGDNNNLMISANAGAVVLDKTNTSAAVHAASSVTANGGMIQLRGTGDDQIFNMVTVTNGGTFDLNGKNEAIGTLTLGNLGLDFGGGSITNSSPTTSTLTLGAEGKLNGGCYVGGMGDIVITGSHPIVAPLGDDQELWQVGTNTLVLAMGGADNAGVRIVCSAGRVVLAKPDTSIAPVLHAASNVRVYNTGMVLLSGSGGHQVYGDIIATNGGTFDMNGYSEELASGGIKLGGYGINNEGALINSSNAAVTLTMANTGYLTADTRVGGVGDITIAGDYPITVWPDTTLNKVGDNTLTLSNGGGDNAGVQVYVWDGKLVLDKTGSAVGGAHAAGRGQVADGAILELAGSGNAQIWEGSLSTVHSGGVLDMNGENQTFTTGSLTINGTGISGGGALVNNNVAASVLSGSLVLGADSYVGGSGDLTISNTVSGASRMLTKVGAGTLTLTGTSTYSGSTIVSAGTLVHNGTNTSSAVGIAGAAFMYGVGSVGPLSPTGTVSAGAAADTVGALRATAMALPVGGTNTWDIANVEGTGGSTWDVITVGGGSGAVTVDASEGTEFVIAITGDPTGFSSSEDYSWTAIDAGSLAGFESSKFTLDLTGFVPAYSGDWSVSSNNGDLVINYGAWRPYATNYSVGAAFQVTDGQMTGGQYSVSVTLRENSGIITNATYANYDILDPDSVSIITDERLTNNTFTADHKELTAYNDRQPFLAPANVSTGEHTLQYSAIGSNAAATADSSVLVEGTPMTFLVVDDDEDYPIPGPVCTNLLVNPGFENAGSGWSVWDPDRASARTDGAEHGSYGLVLTNVNGVGGSFYQELPAEENTIYTLTVRARKEGACDPEVLSLKVGFWTNGVWSYAVEDNIVGEITTEWQTFQYLVVTPDECTQTKPEIIIYNGSANGGRAFFDSAHWGNDDGSVLEVAVGSTYISGHNLTSGDVSTNAYYTITDADVTNFAVNPLRLRFGAFDPSGISRGTDSADTRMNIDIGDWQTDNVLQYEEDESSPLAETTLPGATSTWLFASATVTDLVGTTNEIRATLRDADFDRTADNLSVENQRYGFLIVKDDDDADPVVGPMLTNLFVNPGFETNASGWGMDGNEGWTRGCARFPAESGSYGLWFTNFTANPNGWANFYQVIEGTKASTKYYYSIRAKRTGAFDPATMALKTIVYATGGATPVTNEMNVMGQIAALGSDWGTVSCTFTNPVNTVSNRMEIIIWNDTGGSGEGVLYVDNAVLVEGEYKPLAVSVGTATLPGSEPTANARFTLTDADLAGLDADSPLRMSFGAYDVDSGLSRGKTDAATQMSVSITNLDATSVFALDNVGGYTSEESSVYADTFLPGATSTWAWTAASWDDLEGTNRITASLADTDNDWSGDRRIATNRQYGYLVVVDDDSDPPVRVGNLGANLILNGDIEDGTDGGSAAHWTNENECQVHNWAGHNSSTLGFGFHGWSENAWGNFHQTVPVNMSNGNVFVFSMWAQMEANFTSETRDVTMEIQFWTNGASAATFTVTNNVYDTLAASRWTWQHLTLTATNPVPGCTAVRVWVGFYDAVDDAEDQQACQWDDAELVQSGEPLRVLIGSTAYASSNTLDGVPLFQMTDGEAAGVDGDDPLRLIFSAFDAGSGLLRGNDDPTTQMCVSVVNLDNVGMFAEDNVDEYIPEESSLSTTVPGATNTWKWASADVDALFGTNRVTASLFDADADRAGDRLSAMDQVFGYLAVLDDDSDPPVIRISSTNLLQNWDFETAGSSANRASYWEYDHPSGWTHGNTNGWAAREDWRNYPSGNGHIARAGWGAGQPWGLWWQEVANTYGDLHMWEASAWVTSENGNGQNYLMIEFYDDNMNQLAGGNEVSIPSWNNPDAWTNFTVVATNPVGTAWVRFVFLSTNNTSGGPQQFDYVSLRMVVPAPMSVQIGAADYPGVTTDTEVVVSVYDGQLAAVDEENPLRIVLAAFDTGSGLLRGNDSAATQTSITISNLNGSGAFTVDNVLSYSSTLSSSYAGTFAPGATSVWTWAEADVDILFGTNVVTTTARDADNDRTADGMAVTNQTIGYLVVNDDDTNLPQASVMTLTNNLLQNGEFSTKGSGEGAEYWEADSPSGWTHGGREGCGKWYNWRTYPAGTPLGICALTWGIPWYGTVWQEVSNSVAGTNVWRGSVWYTPEAMTGTYTLAIDFYDGSGTRLGGNVTNFVSFWDYNQSYSNLTVYATNPAGTAWARLTVRGTNCGGGGAFQVDHAELYPLLSTALKVVVDTTEQTVSGAIGGVPVFNLTDSDIGDSASLKLVFDAYDAGSGLSRGNDSELTRMSITVSNLDGSGAFTLDDVGNYKPLESSAAEDTLAAGATSVWSWASVSFDDLEGTNLITATLRDADDDRTADMLSATNVVFGYLVLLDDDADEPAQDAQINSEYLGVSIGTTAITPSSGSGTTNALFVVTDGQLAGVGGDNLLLNPGFEHPTQWYGWDLYIGKLFITDWSEETGQYGVQYWGENPSEYAVFWADVAASPGEIFDVSARVKKEWDFDCTNVMLKIEFLDTDKLVIAKQEVGMRSLLTTSFQTFAVTSDVAIAGTVYARFVLEFNGNIVAGPSAWADNCSMRKVGSDNALRLIFGANDASDLLRGTAGSASTQMNVDVGTWVSDNIANYTDAESSKPATSAGSTSVWKWTSVNYADIGTLCTTGTNIVQATLFDGDNDRTDDQLIASDKQFGLLGVIDDDSGYPCVTTKAMSWVFGVAVGGSNATSSGASTNRTWRVYDGDLAGSTNFMVNYGFEDGGTWWATEGAIGVQDWTNYVPGVAYEAGHVLGFHSMGGTWGYGYQDITIVGDVAGKTFTFAVYGYRDEDFDASNTVLRLEFLDGDKDLLQEHTNDIYSSMSAAWTRYEVSGTAPSDVGYIRVTVDIDWLDDDASGGMKFDSVSLREVSPLALVFGVYDAGSGLFRDTVYHQLNMNVSIGAVVLSNVANYSAANSGADSTSVDNTNVWIWTGFDVLDIQALIAAGSNLVSATVRDRDDDRPNDQLALVDQRFGFLKVEDDDTAGPVAYEVWSVSNFVETTRHLHVTLNDSNRYASGSSTNRMYRVTDGELAHLADTNILRFTFGVQDDSGILRDAAETDVDKAMNISVGTVIEDNFANYRADESTPPPAAGISTNVWRFATPFSTAQIDDLYADSTNVVTANIPDADDDVNSDQMVNEDQQFGYLIVVDDDSAVPILSGFTAAGNGGSGEGAADVFFSEYIEGSGNNKVVEIYNGTGTAIDLAAGSYYLQVYYNGNVIPASEIALSGSIAAGSTYVVADSSASGDILALADQTPGDLDFNGDDAILLRKGGKSGTVLDCIGRVGEDPGDSWTNNPLSTANQTLRRKSSVYEGHTDYSSAFEGVLLSQWDGYPQDNIDGLGAHTFSTAGYMTDAMIHDGGYVITGRVQDAGSGIYADGANAPSFSLKNNEGTVIQSLVTFDNGPAADGDARTSEEALWHVLSGTARENVTLGVYTALVSAVDYDGDRTADSLGTTQSLTFAVIDDDEVEPVPSGMRINRLRNPSFEDWIDGAGNSAAYWQKDTPDANGDMVGNYMRTNSHPWTGAWNMSIPGRWGIHRDYHGHHMQQVYNDTAAGAVWEASVRFWRESAFTAEVIRLEMHFLDAQTNMLYLTNTVVTPPENTWSSYSLFGTTDVGVALVRWQLKADNICQVEGSHLHYDDAFLGFQTAVVFAARSGATNYHLSDTTDTNGLVTVTDGELADASSANPFFLLFGAYDDNSGLSRGTTDVSTQMHISVGSVIANNAENFSLLDSTAYLQTTEDGAVSLWRWDTGFSKADVETLYNAGSSMVWATMYDTDNDRVDDMLTNASQRFGFLRVIDDDTDAPYAQDLKIWDALANTTNLLDREIKSGMWVITMTLVDSSGIATNPGSAPTYSLLNPNDETCLDDYTFEHLEITSTSSMHLVAWRGWAGSVAYDKIFTGVWSIVYSAHDTDDDRTTDDSLGVTDSALILNTTNKILVMDDDTTDPTSPTNLVLLNDGWTNVNHFEVTWDPAYDISGIYQYRVALDPVPADWTDGSVVSLGVASTNFLDVGLLNASFESGSDELEIAYGMVNNWTKYTSGDGWGWYDMVGDDADDGTNVLRQEVGGSIKHEYLLISQDVDINNSNRYSGIVTFSARFKGDLSAENNGAKGQCFLKIEYYGEDNRGLEMVGNEFVGYQGYGTNTLGEWVDLVYVASNMPEDTEWIRFGLGLKNNGSHLAYTGWWDSASITVALYSTEGAFGMTFTNALQGEVTNWAYAVDADNDRPDDRLWSLTTSFVTRLDQTPPSTVTNIVGITGPDEAAEIEIFWNPLPDGGGTNLSPWLTYRIYWTDEARDATNTDSYIEYTNGPSTLGNVNTGTAVISNFLYGLTYHLAIVGLDVAGNQGPISTSAVVTMAGFSVTQGVLTAESPARLDVAWTAATNQVGGYKEYDLLYVDALDFADTLTNQWRLLGRIAGTHIYDEGGVNEDGIQRCPPSALINTMRFYRAAQANMWRTNMRPRVASIEVYGAKTLRLYPGQNWVALPVMPDTNTVKYVLGTNQLPAGSVAANATRIQWFERSPERIATNEVYLGTDGHWWQSIPSNETAIMADDMLMPITDAFCVELPTNGTMHTVTIIGRVPTNQVFQSLPNGVHSLINVNRPRRVHPSQLGLVERGWRGKSGSFPPWEGQADFMWKFDRVNQRVPANEVIWYRTDVSRWYFMNGVAVPTNYFAPDDGIVVNRSGATSPIYDWAPPLEGMYSIPTRKMTP